MKPTKSPFRLLGLSALALALSLGTLRADEGMWTFDNVPAKKMQARYGFAPDQKWLDHVRLSVVRFPGGTGSFVSKDGLVLTNHHVGRGSIQQVSDKDHDYVKNGFYAPTREQEIKVPGLLLYTLTDMLNVTERVNGAVKKGATDKEALKAREVELGRIVDEMQKKTGLHCEQVDLYQGGEYWIYSYKKHSDVRLVFAPEEQIAFFGGDADNFTYPRHDIDFSIFRVYENGKPYTPPAHLQWTRGGLKHQFSYTLPWQRLQSSPDGRRGAGDVALNYRFQLLGDGNAMVACSPRFSLLLPTGRDDQGRGAGAVGYQLNLPISVVLGTKAVTHFNLGATYTPSAKNALGDQADLTAYTFGQSFIWLARPTFNVMLEMAYTSGEMVRGPGLKGPANSFYLSPGIRWAWNFPGGLQVVPGIAVPLGAGPSKGERAVFFYLSFEHPFRTRR